MVELVTLSTHKDKIKDGEIEELLNVLRDKLKKGCAFAGIYVEGEDLGIMHGNLESQYHALWLFEHGKDVFK